MLRRQSIIPAGRAKMLAIVPAALFLAVMAGCTDKTQLAYEEADRARLLLESGDLAGARASIAKALSYRDDQIDILLLDARIKASANDQGAAYDAYRLVLAIDPANGEALAAVAQLGLVYGELVDSLRAAEQILSLDPGNADALLVTGVHALIRRDLADAAAVSDRLLAASPRSEGGTVLKARILMLRGQNQEAQRLLREQLATTGESRMASTLLLELAREEGDAALMLQQLAVLRRLVPQSIDLAIDEINVRYKTGDLAGARAAGRALLTRADADVEAIGRLVELWREYDREPLLPTQISELADAAAPPARIVMARYFLERGQPPATLQLLRGVVGVTGLIIRAEVATGDRAAEERAETLLERDPTDCDALAVRHARLMRGGRAEQAVVAAQTIAAQCLDRNDGFAKLAESYDRLDNATGVRRAYREGVRARPLDTALAAKFVGWLIATGDRNEAIGVARRLARYAPHKASAWRLLERACAEAGDPACLADARAGAVEARHNFAGDTLPGARPSHPLVGHTWR